MFDLFSFSYSTISLEVFLLPVGFLEYFSQKVHTATLIKIRTYQFFASKNLETLISLVVNMLPTLFNLITGVLDSTELNEALLLQFQNFGIVQRRLSNIAFQFHFNSFSNFKSCTKKIGAPKSSQK